MKNQIAQPRRIHYLLTIACCLLLIFTSATANAKQTQGKTAGKKISSKASCKKSAASQSKNNAKHSAKNTAKKSVTTASKASDRSAGKKSGANHTKKQKHSQLASDKHSGKKHKTTHSIANKKKSHSKTLAGNASEPRLNPFHYSPSDYSEKKLQEEMKEYLGIPYRPGGTSVRGMDCSGFARTIYANLFGIELPHNSAAQFNFSKLEEVDEDELQTGDLVFFSRKKHINHVGVYLGNGNFIHATNGNGITISSLDDEHWKSRMVATKRPMSFDKSSMETLQLQGGFDIPLNTGSHLKSYARDEFRPSYNFSTTGPSTGISNTNDEAYNFDSGHLYAYEIEFSHKLWDDSFNFSMSAIHEKLRVNNAWNLYTHDPDGAEWPLNFDSSADDSTTIRNGFKLASEITPFEGLSITPSFIYLNYDQPQSKLMMEVPKRIFGLNTSIAPFTSPWSVSMAMHYADQLDMTDSIFKTTDMFNNMDMSFKLGYYFSKNLEFSFVGKHDFKPVPGRTDLSTSSDSPGSSDFLFKMDLKY